MRKFFKRKSTWLAAAALGLTISLSVGSAMAYFTTYAEAEGGYTVSIGSTTKTKEEFSNWTKHVQVENTGDTECYVRVKAFSGSQFPLSYSGEAGAWSQGEDDYWYYSQILQPGETTSELLIKIENIPEEFKDSFNVVVVQECTKVLYDENGNPYQDWNQVMDSTSGIKGVNGEGADE